MFYNVLFFIFRSLFHSDMVWYGVGVGTSLSFFLYIQLSHPRFFEKQSLRHHLHAKILRGKIPGQQESGKRDVRHRRKESKCKLICYKAGHSFPRESSPGTQDIFPTGSVQVPHLRRVLQRRKGKQSAGPAFLLPVLGWSLLHWKLIHLWVELHTFSV